MLEAAGNHNTTEITKDTPKDPTNAADCCQKQDECIEDLYQLDFEGTEERPMAAGGEVLEPGMHVYVWCSFGSYQHHGIVLQADTSSKNILIAEFTNASLESQGNEAGFGLMQSASASSHTISNGVLGGFRLIIENNPSKWHCVKYRANAVQCLAWRAGTCSGATPDPVDLVLARVRFLADCRHLIPNYHVLSSNCETMAVWCMTGKWETLQGENAMNASKVGSGLLLLAESVLFMPVVGVAVGAATVWHSMHIGSQWEHTTTLLNKQFQWYAMGRRELPKWNLEDTAAGLLVNPGDGGAEAKGEENRR